MSAREKSRNLRQPIYSPGKAYLFTAGMLGKKVGEIVDFSVDDDPAVAFRVVLRDLLGGEDGHFEGEFRGKFHFTFSHENSIKRLTKHLKHSSVAKSVFCSGIRRTN